MQLGAVSGTSHPYFEPCAGCALIRASWLLCRVSGLKGTWMRGLGREEVRVRCPKRKPEGPSLWASLGYLLM